MFMKNCLLETNLTYRKGKSDVEEISLSPMTKALTPTENSKRKWQYKNATQNFDYMNSKLQRCRSIRRCNCILCRNFLCSLYAPMLSSQFRFFMGTELGDCRSVAELIGIKTFTNEFRGIYPTSADYIQQEELHRLHSRHELLGLVLWQCWYRSPQSRAKAIEWYTSGQ